MKIVLAGLIQHTAGDAVMHSVEYTEHLGIGCLGAVLQGAGHEVILQNYFDLAQIKAERPDLIGFSVMTFQDSLARRLAQQIKAINAGITVVVGGPHPSGYPKITLDPNIDFAVIGEGERTIVELVEYLEGKRELKSLRGVAYKKENKVFIAEPQPFIQDLDSLPWPVRNAEILAISKTNPGEYGSGGEVQPNSAQIYYSRGCPFGCNFCNATLMSGKIVRYRSPEKVVQEMAYIQKKFDIHHFTFTDLTFNLNASRVIALCEEIKKQKLDIRWFALVSPVIKDLSIYPAMVSAGWSRGGWGLETTVSMRRRLGKTGDWATIKQTLELCDGLGVMNRIYIMLSPWETKGDIAEIQAMLRELVEEDCIDDLKITFAIPFPGTVLWHQWKRRFLTEGFSRWTTEAPILPNANFTPEEYKQIRAELSNQFFSSDVYRRHCENKIKRFPHLRDPFENLWNSLKSQGLF
ncbi:MAG: radical SAM protein [Patescibacteria group bacterium]